MELSLATIQRIDVEYVRCEWLTIPSFKLWPKPKQNATMWMIKHYIILSHHNMAAEDYLKYMRRARWKINTWKQEVLGRTNRLPSSEVTRTAEGMFLD
jgi:hypothetical protein